GHRTGAGMLRRCADRLRGRDDRAMSLRRRSVLLSGLPALTLTASSDDGGGAAPSGSGTPSATSSSVADPGAVVLAEALDVPVDISFRPYGSGIATLRDRGEIVRIEDGETSTVGTVDGVAADGEGGLLGLAVSPDFEQDRTIFVYTTTDDDNRVLRM